MPKAQEGMEMGQPQGGGDQMQQLAQQVQQMLEQGAAPEQVVAQLLQGGVPPEAIMEVMVGMGMPQEQVQPLIEGVMQQMQGAQGQQGPQGDPQGEPMPEGQPMMKGGGYMKYQGGGENEQEQMMQLIQMFAQIQGIDPNQIMEQLQGASPEEQQQMMQQMVQTVQQAQGGGQPQQPMMFHGGITTSNPGSFVSPNKADFREVKKQMIKKMKGGGQTTDLDTSSTEALVQNLQGTIANWVSKNHRMGLVNKRYDEAMAQFDALPKAELGIDLSKLDDSERAYYTRLKNKFADLEGKSWEELNKAYKEGKFAGMKNMGGQDELSAEGVFQDVANLYGITNPNKSTTTTEEGGGDGTNTNPAIPIGTVYGTAQWNGQQWVPMYGQNSNIQIGDGMGGPAYPQHYFPGWGPGMPNSNPWQQWDKTNFGMMAGAFGAPGSGGLNYRGIGGLKRAGDLQIQQQLAQVLADPTKYGANMEYIPRFLRKDKIRITWDPITGQPTEEGSAQGATKTMAQVTDENGNVRTMSLEEAENQGLTHTEVEVPVTPVGSSAMQDYPGSGMNLATNPRTGEKEYVSERKAERWGRKIGRKEGQAENRNERGNRKLERLQRKTQEARDRTAIAKADAQMYRDKAERIRGEIMDKYGNMLEEQMHGGVTRSNPGGLVWDFKKLRWVKAPQHALFQAKMGVDVKEKRSFDVGQFTEGFMGAVGDANAFMTAARLNPTSDQSTIERSTDNTQQVYDIGSGGRGFYDQEGRFISSDVGDKVMSGTGTDQDVYGSFTAQNFYGDFIPGQGMKYFQGMQAGGLVGDVQFTPQELEELAAFGYDISRL